MVTWPSGTKTPTIIIERSKHFGRTTAQLRVLDRRFLWALDWHDKNEVGSNFGSNLSGNQPNLGRRPTGLLHLQDCNHRMWSRRCHPHQVRQPHNLAVQPPNQERYHPRAPVLSPGLTFLLFRGIRHHQSHQKVCHSGQERTSTLPHGLWLSDLRFRRMQRRHEREVHLVQPCRSFRRRPLDEVMCFNLFCCWIISYRIKIV
jgi:hypothetical protein